MSYQPIAFDDKTDSDSNAPPTPGHSTISTWTLWFGAYLQPLRYIFCGWGRASTTVSRIRDLVTAPDYTPSLAASVVSSCAASLSTSEFSYLLQSLYIDGHTAMYWAIVNDRREALLALVKFTPKLSSTCSKDLRLACVVTSDHALFVQLGLECDIQVSRESCQYLT